MAELFMPEAAGISPCPVQLIVRDIRRALDFYCEAFGAVVRRWILSSDPTSTVGVELGIGEWTLSLCEGNESTLRGSEGRRNWESASHMVYVQDLDSVMQRAVGAGAMMVDPPKNAFWGDRYGSLVDPFGYEWVLLTRKQNLSSMEITRRAHEWLLANQGAIAPSCQ